MDNNLLDTYNSSKLENAVLDYWKNNGIFEKSISSREGNKVFSFFEGPPTANGKPGIHHVIARTLKDIVCRYKTLKGYQVPRKAGWDTQGLPVEIEVEKSLGIRHKEEIESYGVDKFNKACRESVFKYLKDWEFLTERMGYWINLDDAYITYTNEYIESVWWSLKRFFDEGLIYKGYKIQPYCPRCETPLSSHEMAQGYEDVKDPSVYIKFKISNGQDAKGSLDDYKFLVWTTTPWTLISNVALALGPDIDYVKVELNDSKEKLILAKERLAVLKEEYNILQELKGTELADVNYERLFAYGEVNKRGFYTCLADFVTTEDGSGIVHIAPAFGEDDYQLSRKYDLPVLQPVDKSGNFTDEVTDFKGRFVKEADEDIILKLRAESKLYKKEKYLHSYPHCWRCHTPLLYYARTSWYINTSSYKDKMIEKNNEINWVPPETGSGRFGNWLEENRDWALSRDRYWGTPLPIWECECDDCDVEHTAIGSIQELKDRSTNFDQIFKNEKDIDLHKPYVDDIKIKCDKCGCEMKRIEEVIDAWYDSGSMPFAQFHYPFENKELFESRYPADFIAEGVDQTRGWFYTLHAIGVFLFNEKAYKNILVNDLILDKDGMKMSKHKGNVVDPFQIMDEFGADILRWYLIVNSPPWRPKTFNKDDMLDIKNKFFDTYVNTYKFFILYSQITGFDFRKTDDKKSELKERPQIDKWIISELNTLKKNYAELMDAYDLTRAYRAISDFTIDHLSNWYVRRNRKRFRNPENENDKNSAYSTLYEVIREISIMISPCAPFLSEYIYKKLTEQESVHLSILNEGDEKAIDKELELMMETAQKIVYVVRMIRAKNNLKTRQPLRQIIVSVFDEDLKDKIEKVKNIILEEVNVKELNFVGRDSSIIKKKAKANFKLLGPKLGKDIKTVSAAIAGFDNAKINELEEKGSIEIEESGKQFRIDTEDVIIQTENIEGWIVDSIEHITVALDTKLDDELLNEGFAREFINKIQNLRKEKKLGINDRINISYYCESKLHNALLKEKDYIASETLANRLDYINEANINGSEDLNINGIQCKIQIEKLN